MRFAIAALILAVSMPAFAASRKAQCKNRCDSSYQFCVNRATTKQAKKSCKVDRKNCKGSCR
jgi:hypothetical protein